MKTLFVPRSCDELRGTDNVQWPSSSVEMTTFFRFPEVPEERLDANE